MSHYSVYPIQADEPGPHYSGPARVIDCASDDEAIDEAERFVAASDVEVWEGVRFIKVVQRQVLSRLAPSLRKVLDGQ